MGQERSRSPRRRGAPRQSLYVECVIGSIRRECIDDIVVLHQRHLRHVLATYFDHYHRWRCHQARHGLPGVAAGAAARAGRRGGGRRER